MCVPAKCLFESSTFAATFLGFLLSSTSTSTAQASAFVGTSSPPAFVAAGSAQEIRSVHNVPQQFIVPPLPTSDDGTTCSYGSRQYRSQLHLTTVDAASPATGLGATTSVKKENSTRKKKTKPKSQIRKKKSMGAPSTEEAKGATRSSGTGGAQQKRRKQNDRKKALSRKRAKPRKPVSELKLGSWYPGEVVDIRPYGAYVRLYNYAVGGIGALLHMSQIQSKHVHDVNDHLSVGQKLKVRVVRVDKEKSIVGVSLRQPRPPRKAVVDMTDQVGKELNGRIVSLTEYGAFVDIGCKKNALLHKSRISSNERVDDVSKFVKVGERVKVRLIEVDAKHDNMAVSMLSQNSDQFLDWRKQRRLLRQYGAAEAVAAAFEEEEVHNIAVALLDRMESEEDLWDEVLHGEWAPPKK